MQIPNGIVLSTGATIKIENLEVYYGHINGWEEIESYGVTGADQLDQLIWKGGTIYYKDKIVHFYSSLCLVSAQKAIGEGKTPAIQIADRDWNDVSTATKIKMEPPIKV